MEITMLNIQFYTLPLLFCFSFIGLLFILSLYLFFQTKKKLYLGLSLAFLLTTIITSPVLVSDTNIFFDKSYLMTIIGVIGSVTAIIVMHEPKNYKSWLPSGILSGISIISLILPFPLNSLVVSLVMIVYGVYSLMKGIWNGNRIMYNSHAILFSLLGCFGIVGSFYRIDAIFFLFSFFLLIQVIIVLLLFFDRVVLIMRIASYNSVTDPLTGLYNKRFLLNKAKKLANTAEIGIIFIDIDNFKKFNDTRGHDEGDRILKEVAKCLMQEVNKFGYSCRFGGEEMVAIVTNGQQEEIAEKFRYRVENEIGVTVSVGIAAGSGDGVKLIKEADQYMYQAKSNGKNKVVGPKEKNIS